MRRILVLLTTAALLLPGCLSDDAPDDADAPSSDPAPEPEGPREPTVKTGSGTVTSAGTPAGSVGAGDGGASVVVDAGATLLHAEIRWSDPVADLDLGLASPDAGETGGVPNYNHNAAGGAPGMPDSPHSLTIEAPTAGEWLATAFANGAAANVEYEVALTVFYDETAVPEGYTALA